MVPPLPSQASEYVEIKDPDVSKRRKLDNTVSPMAARRIKAQKEEADAAIAQYQDMLHEVFEAEDQMEPDTSMSKPVQSELFSNLPFPDLTTPVLASATHEKLRGLLRTVAKYKRADSISKEYSLRLQKLCEGPMMAVQSLNVRLDGDPSDGDVSHWLDQLGCAGNGLLAMATLLQTMLDSGDDSNLRPEDVIQSIPNSLNNLLENCVIPGVEARPNGPQPELFKIFANSKKVIVRLMKQIRMVLGLFANFITAVDVSESIINTIEFLAIKLVFVDNAAVEKDSALSTQRYEILRRSAMGVLAKVFSKYEDQRSFILNEILASLEKLPSSGRSARQYKLTDGKSIQLLSALVMQLVQTTALQSSGISKRTKAKRSVTGANGHTETDEEDDSDDGDSIEKSDGHSRRKMSPLQKLKRLVDPIHENSVGSAQYITKFIVQRAMVSTKTGDQPYRNLLDLFTEDLISVLGSMDWPASQLLLRILASQLVGIADHKQSGANAKNMALELLGWMGSAITDLTIGAQNLPMLKEDSDSRLADQLKGLFEDHSRNELRPEDLLTEGGPYHMAREFMQEKRTDDDWQLLSAQSFYLAQWSKSVMTWYEAIEDDDEEQIGLATELAKTLVVMIEEQDLSNASSELASISMSQARAAYTLTVLNLGFCKAFDTILKVLLGSITSDQAKIRSRSLKSVVQMLERDPNLLDRDPTIIRVIFRCATDSSPMVRDSALALIGKCVSLKPKLEEEGCRMILTCSSDPTIGVRKRCIILLKEIYSRDSRADLKAAIAEAFLQRSQDHEESVSSLASQTLEEVWFAAFYGNLDNETAKATVNLNQQISLVVKSVARGDAVIMPLERFLRKTLPPGSKANGNNIRVCKKMVAGMVERVLDDSDKAEQQDIFQALTVFAKANPDLFTPGQLEVLQPYIKNLKDSDDLFIFRSIVVIFRCVLPQLSESHKTFLQTVQNDLFQSISKLARSELNEVMACLWTINGVLSNPERLFRLTLSLLKGINGLRDKDYSDPANAESLKRIRSYVRIAGCVGKYCDLETYATHFKSMLPWWKGGTVANLMVESIAPWTLSTQPRQLRVTALESIGSVCESWPAQFGKERTLRSISTVFQEDDVDLKSIVLHTFEEFFAVHEGKSEEFLRRDAPPSSAHQGRLGGSLKASDNDSAAALIAQHFLQDMLRVAVSRQDHHALTAIKVVSSINRQGLVHPKECAGALVALETSTNLEIAKIAVETHKSIHQQHENMFEREYMKAIFGAFQYQRDIVGDSSGVTTRPFTPKLGSLYEIVKISSGKYQRKFLSDLVAKVNFELKKLDVSGPLPEHVQYARFVCENLALLDYGQTSELLHAISCIERAVSATGTAVAHAIETKLLQTGLDANGNIIEVTTETSEQVKSAIDARELKSLAVASVVLMMLWETRTWLRRLYGIGPQVRLHGKANAKEMDKQPNKAQGVTCEKFLETITQLMTCLTNSEAMEETCRKFQTLMSIDDEVKVAADDEAAFDSLDENGSLDDDENPSKAEGNRGRSRKRRSSSSGGGTPKKPRARPRSKPRSSDMI